MDDKMVQIGKRLRNRRKQLNMSQDQLAELAGVTGQTISIAELGKKAMRADTIIGICKALDISADYLLFGSISPQSELARSQKISHLTPEQYRHFQNVISSSALTLDLIRL